MKYLKWVSWGTLLGCAVVLELLKRFVRYCGMVMESSATIENLRRRGASKIQLMA